MRRGSVAVLSAIACVLFLRAPALDNVTHAQGGQQQPGRSIGKVSTQGDLIVFELNDGALGHANMFDLEKQTLRFSPVAAGYQVETGPLRWDAEFGDEMSGPLVTLRNFSFPFSAKSWNTFTVGGTGSIAFAPLPAPTPGPAGGSGGGAPGGGVNQKDHPRADFGVPRHLDAPVCRTAERAAD